MREDFQPKAKESTLTQVLCRYIEAHHDEALSLIALAQQAQLSPYHLQRRFKAAIGVTPKEYLDSCRRRLFKEKLRKSGSVTKTIYEAGFSSPSRVYEASDEKLGMTPKQYLDAGERLEISYATACTILGLLLIAATDRGICGIQFGDSNEGLLKTLREEFPKATLRAMTEKYRVEFDSWMAALNDYLGGVSLDLDLPLDIRGTVFQMKVWKYLQRIPSGSVESYAQVARGIGRPKSVRSVASACARNKSCHRVIRGSGELAGYRWGLERKKVLLDLEKKRRG